MSETWTCPRCGDSATVDVRPDDEIMLCVHCGGNDGLVTRVSFGRLQPRIIVTPQRDIRFVTIQIGDGVYEIDTLHAVMLGDDLRALRPLADAVASALSPVEKRNV